MTDVKRKSGRGTKAALTNEEQALWDHASQSMKPLRKPKGRVLDGADGAALEPVVASAKARGKPGLDGLPGLPKKPVLQPVPARVVAQVAPELAAFDRKSAKRLRAGHIEIDARLDLHGMYQDEAHAALRRFLLAGYANGARWMLVITGKGAPRRSGWFGENGEANACGGYEEARGVLRRNVPRWLCEPDLRAIVVSYTQAAIAHGGEGAIYVQLRKRG
jgi:DNA-nicking Smr family endonuclease